MLSKSLLLVLQALGATATWSAYQEYVKGLPKKITKCASPRPTISFDAIQPYESLPSSAARHKTCYVKSHNDFKTDDSAYVLEAARKCNHGGQVVFPQGVTYVIGKALDLTFLKSVDLGEWAMDSTFAREYG